MIIQIILMIPVLFGAFYFAGRILYAGKGISYMRRSRPRLIACIALTVLGVACLSYIFLSHLELQSKNASLNRILVWISGVYLSLFMYFLMALTILDIIRFLLRHTGLRRVSGRVFMLISAGIAILLTVYGLTHARSIKTIHFELSSENLLSEPLRIVEVSDLHMGSVIDTGYLRRVVDNVNACHPDIVVFLGDQFNRTEGVDVVNAGAMFETLSHIEARLGVYAVLGNHDPELDSEIYQQFLRSGGITPVDNGVLEIAPGSEDRQSEVRTLISASPKGSEAVADPEMSAEGAILLVGRTKLAEDEERVPLTNLLDEAGVREGSGIGGKYYFLVLDHDPDGIPEAVSCDANLLLAGHTHRGQFFPVTLISRFVYSKGYTYGLAQTSNESTGHVTTSIVSSGAGYFQTPIRIGTDSEIVCVDLLPGSDKKPE